MIDFDALKAHFDPAIVSWRVGATTANKDKGMALAYIDARDVLERLDAVCTPAGWQCEYVPMPDHTTCCRIGIKVGDEWIWKANGGSNIAESDKADAQEMAAKGGYSDAFKRAAVQWGIGRYLYDVDSPWVAITQRGRSYVIADGEDQKLRNLLARGVVRGALKASIEATPPKSTEPVTLHVPDYMPEVERIKTAVDQCKTAKQYDGLVGRDSFTLSYEKLPIAGQALVNHHTAAARKRLGIRDTNPIMAG